MGGKNAPVAGNPLAILQVDDCCSSARNCCMSARDEALSNKRPRRRRTMITWVIESSAQLPFKKSN